MNNTVVYFVPCMDTNDLFIKTGFVPAHIRITNLDTTAREEWWLPLGNDAGFSIDNTGDPTANTDKGIKLVKFEDEMAIDASSDPTAYEVGSAIYEANGFQITSDSVMLADDDMLAIEVTPISYAFVKAVHDGGDTKHTYVQDSSLDFRYAGVSTGWIVYNKTNGNYCYVGEVQKPEGQKKYCRVTLVDSNGDALTAADIDDDDVIYMYPKQYAAYPLSDIGAMT